MTKDEALAFLADHQPMPPDTDLTAEVARQYDEARVILAIERDDRAVRLLLNSFGDGDGFGTYQLVEDTLRAYDPEVVVATLADGLESPTSSVRACYMEIALAYPDARLVRGAIGVLGSAGDPSQRFFAAAFLADQPRTEEIVAALRRAAAHETDGQVRDVLDTALR